MTPRRQLWSFRPADQRLRKPEYPGVETRQSKYKHKLNREALRSLQVWVMQYHTSWGSNEETLENYAEYLGRSKNKK